MDSNGPDVKIRGTAAHIYEKYQSLARDAQASGDRIVAENYLQHAEHYYRVMLAAEGPGGLQNRMGPMQPPRPAQQGPNGQTVETDEALEESGPGGPQNGPARYGADQPPQARQHHENNSVRHDHGNGFGNGRSTPTPVTDTVMAKPNGADASGSDQPSTASVEPSAAQESGNGREAARRRNRPPREHDDTAAAPTTETEPGPESSETAG